jgi:putative DNA primase/helicase
MLQRKDITLPELEAENGRLVTTEDQAPLIVVKSVQDFLEHDYPPREYCLEPWLPTQAAALIFAKPGVGKTMFGLSVAFSVATGKSFLKWEAPKPRSVFYLDGEMPGVLLQERVAMFMKAYDAYDAPITIHCYEDQAGRCLDLSQTSDQDVLEPHLGSSELVIVDNVSSLCRTGKENEAESWRPMQAWVLRQRALGRTILLIDHANRQGSYRGTSKKADILDTMIELKEPILDEQNEGARFELHFHKHRGFFGSDIDALDISLMSDLNGGANWTWKSAEATTYERVIAAYLDGVPQRELADLIGLNKSQVSRHLKRARDEGRIG